MPRAPSSQPHSTSAAKAKDSSKRVVKPPLEVMPISVWSPPAQSTEPPPSIQEDLGRERLGADGDEDSLLSNAKLSTGMISRGRMPCLLRRLWLYHSRGSPP